MAASVLWLVLILSVLASAADISACNKANTAFCSDPGYGVTKYSIILRCSYDSGPPQAGNCDDDLSDVPPQGTKFAYCWQTSPMTGDAQCTYNCVPVTAANGTTFYPMGCDDAKKQPTTPSSSSSLTSFAQKTVTAATAVTKTASKTTASGPEAKTVTKMATTTETMTKMITVIASPASDSDAAVTAVIGGSVSLTVLALGLLLLQ